MRMKLTSTAGCLWLITSTTLGSHKTSHKDMIMRPSPLCYASHLQIYPHYSDQGPALLRHVCNLSLERQQCNVLYNRVPDPKMSENRCLHSNASRLSTSSHVAIIFSRLQQSPAQSARAHHPQLCVCVRVSIDPRQLRHGRAHK